MSAALALDIRGRKSGDEPRTPREAPDNLQSTAYAKVLLALGEGEFAGGVTERDIYLDGTPLMAADGSRNFPGVRWEFRPGTAHQSYIQGVPAVENELAVGVELRGDAPWVRALVNTQLSAVRLRLSWPGLQHQEDDGDVWGYTIDYSVDVATDGGAYQQVGQYRVSGKTTTKYERSHRIDLPAATSGWQVRVRRLTPNRNSGRYADTMRIEAITEVIDAKLRYPNTALLYVEFDARQFQNIPPIAVETRGRVIRVPSNYNPDSRSYSGLWDGTFKWAWTDNPAWVFYDILLSERFGLGRRISAAQVDKWELYRIAQYCDQQVPDGEGGTEPRHTCNIYFQDRAEAWTVLRDLAAIFQGMCYWSGSQMVAMADMPRELDYVFTRANVVDGKFTYSGAPEKTRYSMALVSYDNPDNGYQTDVEAVSDNALVRRYGVNQLELSAIGEVRRSGANRRGRWALLTNSRDRGVTFRVGLDGGLPRPGCIIGVADELLAGRPLGGRISAVSGRQITLDRDVQVRAGDRLVVNLPSGVSEGRTVQLVAGRVVTVTTDYSEQPRPQSVWAVDAADLVIQQFRVTGITRPEPGQYEITGVQHDPGKYEHVESGARLEARPISVVPPRVQNPPSAVYVESFSYVQQGLAVTVMRASWLAAASAIAYEVEWRKDDGDWVSAPRTGGLGIEVPGIYAGRYVVRVRAVNALGIASLPAYSAETQLNGKTGTPPALAVLEATPRIFGIELRWAFPAGAGDTQRTEIQYNTAPAEEGVLHLGDYAYPANTHTLTGLAGGVRLHFRGRLVDRTGNIGPWSAWVMGQSSADAAAILGYLDGEILETHLGQHLLGRVDLVDGDGAGSVNERLVNTRSALMSQINALQAQLAEVTGAAEYSPSEGYLAGALVRYEGAIYQAKSAVAAGVLPTDTTYWLKVGDYATVGEAVAAIALELDELTSRVAAAEHELSAQVQRINVIQAALPGKADVSALTALSGTVTQQGNTLTAQGERIDAFDVRLGGAESAGEAAAGALTQLDSRVTDAEGLLQAVSEKTDGVYAKVSPPMAGSSGWKAGSTAVRAGVWSLQSAIATADRAMGKRVDQTEAQLGETAAVVQQTSQAVVGLEGELEAMWSVKLQVRQDGRYALAGVAAGIENTPNGLQSQILLMADRVGVLSEINGEPVSAWVVQGGQVIMNSALIGKASIGTAHIEDGAITRAKVGSAAIGSAQIEDAAITTAKIGDAQVDTLKIAGNSVTAPYFMKTAVPISVSSSWVTLMESVPISYREGIYASILCVVRTTVVVAGGSGGTLAVTLDVIAEDGATVFATPIDQEIVYNLTTYPGGNNGVFSAATYLPKGRYSYRVRARAASIGPISVFSASVSVNGSMR